MAENEVISGFFTIVVEIFTILEICDRIAYCTILPRNILLSKIIQIPTTTLQKPKITEFSGRGAV